MQGQSRAWSGHGYRPLSQISFESVPEFAILLSSWGPRSASEKVDRWLRETLMLSKEPDVTRLHEIQETWSLQIAEALKSCHTRLMNQDNKQQYEAAIEACVLVRDEGLLHWAFVGCYQIYVYRSEKWIPVCITTVPSQGQGQTPLVQQALGVPYNFHVQSGELSIQTGDKIFVYQGSERWPQIFSSTDLDGIVNELRSTQEQSSFSANLIEIL